MTPEHRARVRLALTLLLRRHEDSRATVGALLEVSPQAIGRILADQNGASVATTARLARAIGVASERAEDGAASRALRVLTQDQIRAHVAALAAL